MTETAAAATLDRAVRPPWWRRFGLPGDLWVDSFLALAAEACAGRLTVTTPDGRRFAFRGTDAVPGPDADIALADPAAARRLFLGGPVGFGEAYVDGLWTSGDLPSLLEFAARNAALVTGRARGMAPLRWLRRIYHRARANTRAGSRRNIAQHYDLGNDFYRLWLDPGMSYSSALYLRDGMTLEEAQDAKLARVAEMLDVAAGQRVLEIGCGWGGMAEHLAARGAWVTGITLSREQLAWAGARLAGRAELRLQDYRDVEGRFDRVVSVEMIEAVGREHWPRYFATLRDRLLPGGVAVVQAITIADGLFDRYSGNPDFIQRHIFPGGVLPSPGILRERAAAAGLVLEREETFGASYARTCAEWRRRFHAAWPEIARLGFDERFRRMWDYYLAYCEGGFRAGSIDVGLYRLVRP